MCGYKANFWNLPFANETFDVVCTHKGLDLSSEINRTIQEISRVLKKDGRFVCNSWCGNSIGLGEKRFFDYLDKADSEYKTIYRKAKLYTGFDDLVDLSNENNLSLFQHKTFRNNYSSDDIVSVFTKS